MRFTLSTLNAKLPYAGVATGVAVIWGPHVLGTPHPRITSESGMGVPIMPGGFGIPVGPKVLGIWGPHSVMGTPHT